MRLIEAILVNGEKHSLEWKTNDSMDGCHAIVSGVVPVDKIEWDWDEGETWIAKHVMHNGDISYMVRVYPDGDLVVRWRP